MNQIVHPEEPAAGFARKLLAAQRAARDIVPTKKHYDGYLFAPLHQVIRELRAHLHTQGLVVQTAVEGFTEFETSTKRGQPQWMTTVDMRFYVTDQETGFTREYSFIGRGLNEKDKGVTHALQSGKKYFLLSLLMVEVDEDAREHQEQQQKPRRKRIPEAQGITFFKDGEGNWTRGDTGDILRSCMAEEEHDRGEVPMIRVPEGGSRWLCIQDSCGHVESHDAPPEDEELGGGSYNNVEKDEGQARNGREVVNNDKRVHHTRAAVERLIEKYDVYEWQWRAIVLWLDFPDNLDAWGAERWERVHEGLRRKPDKFIAEALKYMAKDTPADEERIKYLRSLYDEKELTFAQRAEAEAAIKSGWHDAIEDVLMRWERDHIEEPELALTEGAASE